MVVCDFGSRMGATMRAQVRLDAVIVAAGRFMTSPDIGFRPPVNGRPVCCRHSHRGSNRFEVGGATPQTAVFFVVARRYSSGLLNFAAHSQKIANAKENAVLRAPSGPYRRDCSSTGGYIAANSRGPGTECDIQRRAG